MMDFNINKEQKLRVGHEENSTKTGQIVTEETSTKLWKLGNLYTEMCSLTWEPGNYNCNVA